MSNTTTAKMTSKESQLYKSAIILAIFTVVYNVIEGIVATYFGMKNDTLTLFGFGVDSFVETVSAVGITQMAFRIRKNPDSERGSSEVLALRITGWCFYILAVILLVSAIYNIIVGQEPISTLPGVIIAGISILAMWILIKMKISLGKKLNNSAIISDAKCNQVCLYMSLILLASSALWWLFEIPYVDAIGALGLVYFSITEGREAFDKAKGVACHHDC